MIETFTYQGGKRKIIPQIIDLMPNEKFDLLFDVFTGSSVVGINLLDYTKHLICSDTNEALINMLTWLTFNKEFQNSIIVPEKSKEAYLTLRENYNKTKSPMDLYMLLHMSFSNYMRFNSKGDFNLPYGERLTFDKERLAKHIQHVKGKNISYVTKDCFEIFKMAKNSIQWCKTFLFCDSPYLNTTATYNEKNGWTEHQEMCYYENLIELDKMGAKWMVTNVITNRGKHNHHFEEFSKKYNSVQTISDFRKTSHVKSNKQTVELIVRNYV